MRVNEKMAGAPRAKKWLGRGVAGVFAGGMLALTALPGTAAGQKISQGERLWLQCKACHTIEKGAAARLGPNLYGIVGDKAGQRKGFKYSKALGGSNITWTEGNLDKWIERPNSLLSGHRMIYLGMKNPAERKALIAYLKKHGD